MAGVDGWGVVQSHHLFVLLVTVKNGELEVEGARYKPSHFIKFWIESLIEVFVKQ